MYCVEAKWCFFIVRTDIEWIGAYQELIKKEKQPQKAISPLKS